MKSSKYESVKFNRFVFGTTRRSTRLRQSNKTVNVLHQLNLPDWPTKSPVNLNQHAWLAQAGQKNWAVSNIRLYLPYRGENELTNLFV